MSPTAHKATPGGGRTGWFAVAIIGAVWLTYGGGLGAPFIFDDGQAVVNNPTIRQWWPLTDVLRPPADGTTTTGRPILNLSYALNRAIAGEASAAFRAGNLLIHALAGLALLGVTRRALEGRAGVRAARWIGFGVALLWTVHPLQSETVMSVAQRSESLCALLYLLALLALARGASAASSGRARGWLAAAVAASALAMGAKEVAVTLPVVALLYDRTFLAGTFAEAWRRRGGWHLALASTWLVLILLLLAGGGTRGDSAGFGLGVSPWSYLCRQCDALLLYLKLSVWPHPLVLDYGTAVATFSAVWWKGVVIVGLLVLTVWALVRRPAVGFALACFFVILAPSSSVVPLGGQTIAEHRMYLPLAALVALAATAVSRWRTVPAFGGWALAVVAFAGLTLDRVGDYRTEEGIWRDTVAKVPDNPRAHGNLGTVLVALDRPDEAIPHFEAAARLAPDDSVAQHNLGNGLDLTGRRVEAIPYYERALALNPGNTNARLALANAFAATGRPDEAWPQFEAAARLAPGLPVVHRDWARALQRAGRWREAEVAYRAALALDARQPVWWAELGETLARAGRMAEAESVLRSANEQMPGSIELQNNLGMLLVTTRRPADAIPWFEEVARARPESAQAWVNLGNARLLNREAQAAMTAYEQALRLRPDDREISERLAMARRLLEGGR